MTATEREIAAFWLGFGMAMRGAFGPQITQATSLVLAPRIFGKDHDSGVARIVALMADLPQEADDELRALMEAAKLAGVSE